MASPYYVGDFKQPVQSGMHISGAPSYMMTGAAAGHPASAYTPPPYAGNVAPSYSPVAGNVAPSYSPVAAAGYTNPPNAYSPPVVYAGQSSYISSPPAAGYYGQSSAVGYGGQTTAVSYAGPATGSGYSRQAATGTNWSMPYTGQASSTGSYGGQQGLSGYSPWATAGTWSTGGPHQPPSQSVMMQTPPVSRSPVEQGYGSSQRSTPLSFSSLSSSSRSTPSPKVTQPANREKSLAEKSVVVAKQRTWAAPSLVTDTSLSSTSSWPSLSVETVTTTKTTMSLTSSWSSLSTGTVTSKATMPVTSSPATVLATTSAPTITLSSKPNQTTQANLTLGSTQKCVEKNAQSSVDVPKPSAKSPELAQMDSKTRVNSNTPSASVSKPKQSPNLPSYRPSLTSSQEKMSLASKLSIGSPMGANSPSSGYSFANPVASLNDYWARPPSPDNVDDVTNNIYRKFTMFLEREGPLNPTHEKLLNIFTQLSTMERKIVMAHGSIKSFLGKSERIEVRENMLHVLPGSDSEEVEVEENEDPLAESGDSRSLQEACRQSESSQATMSREETSEGEDVTRHYSSSRHSLTRTTSEASYEDEFALRAESLGITVGKPDSYNQTVEDIESEDEDEDEVPLEAYGAVGGGDYVGSAGVHQWSEAAAGITRNSADLDDIFFSADEDDSDMLQSASGEGMPNEMQDVDGACAGEPEGAGVSAGHTPAYVSLNDTIVALKQQPPKVERFARAAQSIVLQVLKQAKSEILIEFRTQIENKIDQQDSESEVQTLNDLQSSLPQLNAFVEEFVPKSLIITAGSNLNINCPVFTPGASKKHLNVDVPAFQPKALTAKHQDVPEKSEAASSLNVNSAVFVPSKQNAEDQGTEKALPGVAADMSSRRSRYCSIKVTGTQTEDAVTRDVAMVTDKLKTHNKKMQVGQPLGGSSNTEAKFSQTEAPAEMVHRDVLDEAIARAVKAEEHILRLHAQTCFSELIQLHSDLLCKHKQSLLSTISVQEHEESTKHFEKTQIYIRNEMLRIEALYDSNLSSLRDGALLSQLPAIKFNHPLLPVKIATFPHRVTGDFSGIANTVVPQTTYDGASPVSTAARNSTGAQHVSSRQDTNQSLFSPTQSSQRAPSYVFQGQVGRSVGEAIQIPVISGGHTRAQLMPSAVIQQPPVFPIVPQLSASSYIAPVVSQVQVPRISQPQIYPSAPTGVLRMVSPYGVVNRQALLQHQQHDVSAFHEGSSDKLQQEDLNIKAKTSDQETAMAGNVVSRLSSEGTSHNTLQGAALNPFGPDVAMATDFSMDDIYQSDDELDESSITVDDTVLCPKNSAVAKSKDSPEHIADMKKAISRLQKYTNPPRKVEEKNNNELPVDALTSGAAAAADSDGFKSGAAAAEMEGLGKDEPEVVSLLAGCSSSEDVMAVSSKVEDVLYTQSVSEPNQSGAAVSTVSTSVPSEAVPDMSALYDAIREVIPSQVPEEAADSSGKLGPEASLATDTLASMATTDELAPNDEEDVQQESVPEEPVPTEINEEEAPLETAAEEPPVETDETAAEEPPVETDETAAEEPPVETDETAAEEPPVGTDETAAEEPPVETDETAAEKPPVETDETAAEEPPVETDETAAEEPPVETDEKVTQQESADDEPVPSEIDGEAPQLESAADKPVDEVPKSVDGLVQAAGAENVVHTRVRTESACSDTREGRGSSQSPSRKKAKKKRERKSKKIKKVSSTSKSVSEAEVVAEGAESDGDAEDGENIDSVFPPGSSPRSEVVAADEMPLTVQESHRDNSAASQKTGSTAAEVTLPTSAMEMPDMSTVAADGFGAGAMGTGDISALMGMMGQQADVPQYDAHEMMPQVMLMLTQQNPLLMGDVGMLSMLAVQHMQTMQSMGIVRLVNLDKVISMVTMPPEMAAGQVESMQLATSTADAGAVPVGGAAPASTSHVAPQEAPASQSIVDGPSEEALRKAEKLASLAAQTRGGPGNVKQSGTAASREGSVTTSSSGRSTPATDGVQAPTGKPEQRGLFPKPPQPSLKPAKKTAIASQKSEVVPTPSKPNVPKPAVKPSTAPQSSHKQLPPSRGAVVNRSGDDVYGYNYNYSSDVVLPPATEDWEDDLDEYGDSSFKWQTSHQGPRLQQPSQQEWPSLNNPAGTREKAKPASDKDGFNCPNWRANMTGQPELPPQEAPWAPSHSGGPPRELAAGKPKDVRSRESSGNRPQDVRSRESSGNRPPGARSHESSGNRPLDVRSRESSGTRTPANVADLDMLMPSYMKPPPKPPKPPKPQPVESFKPVAKPMPAPVSMPNGSTWSNIASKMAGPPPKPKEQTCWTSKPMKLGNVTQKSMAEEFPSLGGGGDSGGIDTIDLYNTKTKPAAAQKVARPAPQDGNDDSGWEQVGGGKKKKSSTASKPAPAANNFDRLTNKLQETYPSMTGKELTELIGDVRKKKGTLKGLKFQDILDEAAKIVAQKRAKVLKAIEKNKKNPLYKTQICEFWKAGQCVTGAACVYAHGKHELVVHEKTMLCHHVANRERCPYGDKCIYAHNVNEIVGYRPGGKLNISKPNVKQPVMAAPAPVRTPAPKAAAQRARAPAARWDDKPTCSYPSFEHSAIDDEEGDECAICYEILMSSHNLQHLDCGHIFHDGCIRRWLIGEESTCPTCRRHVLLAEEFPALGRT